MRSSEELPKNTGVSSPSLNPEDLPDPEWNQSLLHCRLILYQLSYPESLKDSLRDVQKGNDRDFPGGSVVKNPPANAGDTGSIPDQGRSHMWRNN